MHLITLGDLRLQSQPYKRKRPLLLLTYLAVEGPQERRFLADLFWPGSSNAPKNLTTVLSRLKQLDTNLIQAEGPRLSSSISCDAVTLLNQYEKKAYAEVIRLYQGKFLEGLRPQDLSTELEEWLFAKREAIGTIVRLARLQVAEALAHKGRFEDAAKEAEKAYLLSGAAEPDETTLKRLYCLLVAGGNPQSYEVKKEAESYGLDYALNQEAAKHKLSSGVAQQTSTTPPDPASQSNTTPLPKQTTPFIGRGQELEHLQRQLRSPGCRLLSIIGAGGMGKTRLALALAEKCQQEHPYFDGIGFVSFVSVSTTDAMLPALGDALSLTLSSQIEPKEQLATFLKDKELLLILDNLEHLLDGAELFADLLECASGLTLLTTSREPLHLQAEHVFELYGLEVPSNESYPHEADAVKLFVQRAQMKQGHFHLDESNRETIIEICQLVGGMPLALELAATWLRILPVEAIPKKITQSLDFLKTKSRDVPERHSSIRAVFDYSWQLLDEAEQSVMRQLATFNGGFTLEAAQAVFQVEPDRLVSLIDKSLLNLVTSRYRRHPFVIQYCQEKLAEHPKEKQLAEQMHAEYYLDLLIEQGAKLNTGDRLEALAVLNPERANLKTAWQWAVGLEEIDLLKQCVVPIYWLFENRLPELLSSFNTLEKALDINEYDHQAVLGYTLSFQSRVIAMQSPEIALQKINQGHDLLKRNGDFEGLSWNLFFKGWLQWFYFGDRTQASHYFEKALQLAREYQLSDVIGFSLTLKIHIQVEQGDYQDLIGLVDKTVLAIKALDNSRCLSSSLAFLGAGLTRNGYLTEGIVMLQEAAALAERYQYDVVYTQALFDIAEAYVRIKDYKQAEDYAKKSLALAKKVGLPFGEMKAHNHLGKIMVVNEFFDQASSHLLASLHIAWNTQHQFGLQAALLALAELKLAQKNSEEATVLLSFLTTHEKTEKHDLFEAQALLDLLYKQSPREVYEKAIDQGRSLKLNELVPKLLVSSLSFSSQA